MKKLILQLLMILTLASCSPSSALPPTDMPSDTPQPTETLTPTVSPTRTPKPTVTPLPVLTAADVGLPWDITTKATVKHLPCYVNTDTRFHAGDGFYFTGVQDGEIINVVAPIPGKVVYSAYTNDFVGQNVIVETPFVINGERVCYQIVHFNKLLVNSGVWLNQEDKIGELVRGGIIHGDPRGTLLLDFGVYHTNNGCMSVDAGTSADINHYVEVSTLVADDLENIPNSVELPICEGNPK